jgi:hypothetical protein
MRTALVTLTICVLALPANAKYSGGTGGPNDPYQIATAADMIALGETPEDYDKHFILTADIDLDPNLSGRKVFDKAVIAADSGTGESDFQEAAFTGVFDGSGHTIAHVTIEGDGMFLGLFGRLGSGAEVKELGLVGGKMTGSGIHAGGLVGHNRGSLTRCHSAGAVSGWYSVGGLVGMNDGFLTQCHSTGAVSGGGDVGGLVGLNYSGPVTRCHSTGAVSGTHLNVGGLIGGNWRGIVTGCYSTGAVNGGQSPTVGGLVGWNGGTVSQCYSTGAVSQISLFWVVGGLLGCNEGEVIDSYSTGAVSGKSWVGGLVGYNSYGTVTRCYNAGAVSGTGKFVGGLVAKDLSGTLTASFWDTKTAGQTVSAGGTGKTTAQMQTAKTLLDAGWDFVGETVNGTEDIWWILDGKDYPRLWWERVQGDDFEDDKPEPLWFVYEPEPELAHIREVNGRLEVSTVGAMDNVDAMYVSDGWRLDVTKNFAIRVDFHFSKRGPGDGRVTLGVGPSLDPSARQWAELEAGCFDTGPFYLYEVSDGFWVQEVVADRSSDSGTIFMSYNPDADELYFSYTGYGKANAWQMVAGLLAGRWAGEPVYVILGGGSEGMAFGGAEAWLDNFVVNAGMLISAEPDGAGGSDD